MAESFAIEGGKLTRQFGGFFALKGVDLAVTRGEIRGLIGPNGAGKSTLIDVLSGRAEHRSGTVKMFGADISAMTAQQRRRARQLPVEQQLDPLVEAYAIGMLLGATFRRKQTNCPECAQMHRTHELRKQV